MSALTKSERQQGKPAVPVETQRRRILAALAGGFDLPMSCLAYAAFPDFRFRSAQGAALCISRTVRGLADDGLVRGTLRGYQITAKGKAEHGATPPQENDR